MDPHVVVREIATAAADFHHLPSCAGPEYDLRADCRTVTADPLETDGDPMPAGRIVPQQNRPVVESRDQDVDVAVIVHVAERGAAARMLHQQWPAHLFGDQAVLTA